MGRAREDRVDLVRAAQDQAEIDLAVSWVLANPQVFLLTTGDVDVLPKLLDAAERAGERPTDEQMAELGAGAAVHLASSRSRTVRSSVSLSNGFSRKALPGGRLPRPCTVSAV